MPETLEGAALRGMWQLPRRLRAVLIAIATLVLGGFAVWVSLTDSQKERSVGVIGIPPVPGPHSPASASAPKIVRLVTAENNGVIIESHQYRIADAALEVDDEGVWIHVKTEPRGTDRVIRETDSPWINFTIVGPGFAVKADGGHRDKLTMGAPDDRRLNLTGWFRAEGISPNDLLANREKLTLTMVVPN